MTKEYKITPRNLGSLALEDICLSDFWYLSKLHFHPPFNNFGAAIFNNCQAMQEAAIGYYLAKDGRLPKQFAPFCDIKARADVNKHFSKFGYMHESGVWLYGSPDEVLVREDDSIVIVDHKTAHPKSEGKKDRFQPQYQIQTIGYGLIAEDGFQLGETSGGALFYWDIQHESVISNPGNFIEDGKLWTYFVPKVIPVEIDYSRIEALLKEAKKIWKSKTPPEGEKGCEDCKKLKALLAVQDGVDSELNARDQHMWYRYGNYPGVRETIARQLEDRRWAQVAALRELHESGDSLQFDEESIVSNWEFLGGYSN
jgi:hypothetical protein